MPVETSSTPQAPWRGRLQRSMLLLAGVAIVLWVARRQSRPATPAPIAEPQPDMRFEVHTATVDLHGLETP